MRKLVAGKLHGIYVTEANLNYHGSITLDPDHCEEAGILPMEFVEIWNRNSGARISTYVILGERGSRCCVLNGATARTCQPGDQSNSVYLDESRITSLKPKARRRFFGVLPVTLEAYICSPFGIVTANEALLFPALGSEGAPAARLASSLKRARSAAAVARQRFLLHVTSDHRKGCAFCRHDFLRALDRPQDKVAPAADFHGSMIYPDLFKRMPYSEFGGAMQSGKSRSSE
ncbi:Aspartate 1-decarboxylase 2 [Ensifer psoraleae]|nr:Aspartate 1-decarboxylase 2 [Sinorhizobium psoraleae]